MQPTIAIAYGDPNNAQIERDLLKAIDARLVHIGGLDTPEARATIS
jgi:hypothetical protein